VKNIKSTILIYCYHSCFLGLYFSIIKVTVLLTLIFYIRKFYCRYNKRKCLYCSKNRINDSNDSANSILHNPLLLLCIQERSSPTRYHFRLLFNKDADVDTIIPATVSQLLQSLHFDQSKLELDPHTGLAESQEFFCID
jgi:hypothetical protein